MLRMCTFAFALFLAITVVTAAPAQNTLRPGDPTQARVLIENRGNGEAIPVAVVDVGGAPLQVTVSSPISLRPETVVGTLAGRQVWEYTSVPVRNDQRAADVIAALGRDGWEATGVQQPVQDGLMLLLKRPAVAVSR